MGWGGLGRGEVLLRWDVTEVRCYWVEGSLRSGVTASPAVPVSQPATVTVATLTEVDRVISNNSRVHVVNNVTMAWHICRAAPAERIMCRLLLPANMRWAVARHWRRCPSQRIRGCWPWRNMNCVLACLQHVLLWNSGERFCSSQPSDTEHMKGAAGLNPHTFYNKRALLHWKPIVYAPWISQAPSSALRLAVLCCTTRRGWLPTTTWRRGAMKLSVWASRFSNCTPKKKTHFTNQYTLHTTNGNHDGQ